VQLDKVFWRLLAEGSPALREEYDLAVAYIEGASAYYLADRVRARRKAAFIHIDYQKAGYTKAMDRGCYDGVDRIFVVSREVGERFCAVYPEHRNKVELFRNILDVDAIRRKAEAGEGFSDGYRGVRLLTVGRLTRQKGYDVAIEALARIRTDGYDARWYVVGEGPERADLERRIERHGMQGEFVLLGAKENPYPYVKQADLYVHATRFEGKSIAVEEAQVLGKPIAASDCTGNAEQVASGYDGILFPLSAENIAKAVESLIDDPALRLALGARAAEKKLIFPEDTDNLLTLTEAEEMP
jgi:glycosyltransferase involved in cell wall biosynthesis